MEQRVIGFIPPIIGAEAEFNTFRLSGFYAKHLTPGEEVLLLNEKEKLIFGKAVVTQIDTGILGELCIIHAHLNHTQLGLEPNAAPQRLFALLQRIYGPHIAKPIKKTTVISMKRLE